MRWWDLLLLPIQWFIQLTKHQILLAAYTGVWWMMETWAEKGGLLSQNRFVGDRDPKHRKKALNYPPQTLSSVKWVVTAGRRDHHVWAAAGKSKALSRRLGKVTTWGLFQPEWSYCPTLLCLLLRGCSYGPLFSWRHTKCQQQKGYNAQQRGNNSWSSTADVTLDTVYTTCKSHFFSYGLSKGCQVGKQSSTPTTGSPTAACVLLLV